jgi:hypothetical protein
MDTERAVVGGSVLAMLVVVVLTGPLVPLLELPQGESGENLSMETGGAGVETPKLAAFSVQSVPSVVTLKRNEERYRTAETVTLEVQSGEQTAEVTARVTGDGVNLTANASVGASETRTVELTPTGSVGSAPSEARLVVTVDVRDESYVVVNRTVEVRENDE